MQAFRDARPALIGLSQELQAAKDDTEPRGSKRKRQDLNGDDSIGLCEPSTTRRKTRSQSQRSPDIRPTMPSHIPDSEEDEDYQPGMIWFEVVHSF